MKQILLIARKTYDPTTGLTITDGMKAANRNGQIPKPVVLLISGAAVSDGMGAALVDVLDYLPQETTGRDSVMQILQGLAKTLVKYQDPQSGTWYQVTDQGAREGNYLESSATALFIYTLAKAVNKGYIARTTSNLPAKLLMEWSRHLPILKKTAAIPLRIVVR